MLLGIGQTITVVKRGMDLPIFKNLCLRNCADGGIFSEIFLDLTSRVKLYQGKTVFIIKRLNYRCARLCGFPLCPHTSASRRYSGSTSREAKHDAGHQGPIYRHGMLQVRDVGLWSKCKLSELIFHL